MASPFHRGRTAWLAILAFLIGTLASPRLSACAGHYEKLGDTATATIAIDEWLALNPNYYTNLLAKGRLSLAEKKYDARSRARMYASSIEPTRLTM